MSYQQDYIDETIDESFPASDPPSFDPTSKAAQEQKFERHNPSRTKPLNRTQEAEDFWRENLAALSRCTDTPSEQAFTGHSLLAFDVMLVDSKVDICVVHDLPGHDLSKTQQQLDQNGIKTIHLIGDSAVTRTFLAMLRRRTGLHIEEVAVD